MKRSRVYNHLYTVSMKKTYHFLSGAIPVFILSFGTIVLPFIAEAGKAVDEAVGIMCNIANYLFTFALVIGVIYAIVGAFKYMSSGGDATKVSEGHKTLTWAAVGIGIAILAGSFPGVIASLMGTTATACK